jgi:hypothetical protein
MAHWHGLAKLRQHADATLAVMDRLTILLGKKLSSFEKNICSAYRTRELKREMEARGRRQAKKDAPNSTTAPLEPQANESTSDPIGHSSGHRTSNLSTDPTKGATIRRATGFSLHTYKLHALGDYPSTIRMFGTTDLYSTELVNLPNSSNTVILSQRFSTGRA